MFLTGLPVARQSRGTRRPLGFQVYTVRNLIPDLRAKPSSVAPRSAIARLRYTGFEQRLLPLLQRVGIQASAAFCDAAVTGNFDAWKSQFHKAPPPDDVAEAVDDRRSRHESICDCYRMPAEPAPRPVPPLRDQFNKCREQHTKAGMQFCYHHHAFDSAPRKARADRCFLNA